MSETMKTRIFSLLSAVIYLMMGGLILVNPGATLSSMIMVLGIFLLVGGIFLIIDGFRLTNFVAFRTAYILDGVLLALLGAIFIFGNSFIHITILSYMLVIWFMASAVIQIFIVWSIGGWVSIISIILNMFIIVFSFMALFDPTLAQGFLIWYLAFEFILAGINKLFMVFAPKRELQ